MRPDFLAFSDEIQKLAGREKKEKMVDAKPTPMLARVAGGAMGAGMIAGQAPLLKNYAAGRGTLYHATNLDAAEGILGSHHGIDPNFAGIGQRSSLGQAAAGAAGFGNNGNKAARINRYLMGESLNRLLEEHGVPLDYEHMVNNVDQFHKLMDGGMRASEAAAHVTKGVTDDLVRSKKLDPHTAETLSKKLQETLPSFGKRVYMGTHPADVKAWASGASEAQMLIEKQMALAKKMRTPLGKAQVFASDMGNALFGGLPTTIRDAAKRMQYKPHSTEHMTLEQAKAAIAQLRASGTKAGAIFGASVPSGQMGYMQDFPVVRQLVNLNPGLKSTLSKFVETYDPGRDLSFPHSVPSKNLKMVDLVDHATGNVRRIHISDAVDAARSPIGQRLKNVAAPLAFSALGGMALYRAFKPKKRKVPASSPLAATAEDKKKAKKPMRWGLSKASSVGGDVANFAKYVVPIVGGTALVAAGSGALADRLLPEKTVNKRLKGMDKLKAHGVEGARGVGRNLAANLATMGVGAGAGALLAKPIASRVVGAHNVHRLGKVTGMGAGIGALIAQSVGSPVIAGRETAKHPEADPYYQALPEKSQNFLRKHPSVGAIREAALMAGIPIAGAYAVRKYYPSTYARAALGIRKGIAHFAG